MPFFLGNEGFGRFSLAQTYGFLLLSMFVLYGLGSSLLSPFFAGLFIFLNSVAAVLAGWVGLLIMGSTHKKVGIVYIFARKTEAVLLFLGGVCFPHLNELFYLLAMAIFSAGSIPFFVILLKDQLLPGWLACWGIIGYAIFSAGSIVQLVTGNKVSIMAAAPGGLAEIVTGIFLLSFGFQANPSRNHDDVPLLPTHSSVVSDSKDDGEEMR